MRLLGVVLSTQYLALSTHIACLIALGFTVTSTFAQTTEPTTSLPPTEITLLDAASLAHLENSSRFLNQRQWSEAVEAIRRVQESEPSRLVKVEMDRPVAGFERFVTAGDYCQWRLAALATNAPEALAHFRRLVDPLAETWLREAQAASDGAPLRRILQQAFASQFGDDALLKLGDLALARGDFSAARAAWQQIYPNSAPTTAATTRLGAYPESDLDPAAVLARLVLASILEGSRQRASKELASLRMLYPEATGHLAGRDGRYTDLLQSLLDESASWSPARQSPDWPTFAGDSSRAKTSAAPPDLAQKLLWTYPLPRLSAARESIGTGRLRVAEDAKALLSYHPTVVGKKVLLRFDANGNSSVVALDLNSGQRLWQVDHSREIGRLPPAEAAHDTPPVLSDAHADLPRHTGVTRYTASAVGDKFFARLGSPITGPASRRAALWLAKDQGFLLGLDLATQGKPLEGFPILPPSGEWSFEGSPICDDGVLYVAMRRAEAAHSQFYVAAFDLQTTPTSQPDDVEKNPRPSGRIKWRTRICSSATLGGSEIDQITHLLLTKDGDRLYLNTSAGCVAALHADDGSLQWLVKYPRAAVQTGNPDAPEHRLFRDLTPCLAWKDLLIVAPADCDRFFALQAATGQFAWTLPPGAADDAIHLLGVADDTLIASGDSLYFLDVHTGRLMARYPPGRLGGTEQAAPSPRGFGRGTIAGNQVWWPTRESILVFAARPATTDFGWQPHLVREIPLLPHGITGGNLIITDGTLLIAGGDKLAAFGM